MSQPKITRLMTIMQKLSFYTPSTLEEIASDLDISKRTVQRYIQSLKSSGFEIQHDNEYRFWISEYPKNFEQLEKYIPLEPIEAQTILDSTYGLEDSCPFKEQLIYKLKGFTGKRQSERLAYNREIPQNIDRLRDAIDRELKVVLVQYSSNHSKTISDRHVEPFAMCDDCHGVWAYDTDKKMNRVFKISRIGSVRVIPENWEFRHLHRMETDDCFQMSGECHEHVILEMDLRAKNLLCEEFHRASKDVRKISVDKWIFDTEVNAMEGIGRFVISMASDVRIIEGDRLKEYIGNYTRDHLSQYM